MPFFRSDLSIDKIFREIFSDGTVPAKLSPSFGYPVSVIASLTSFIKLIS